MFFIDIIVKDNICSGGNVANINNAVIICVAKRLIVV